MKFKFSDEQENYDGSQLVSLRNYLKFGMLGDSILAWIGACDVSVEHMVDGEDLLAKAEIRGSKMLHFIIEKFDCDLLGAVALQRLFASVVKDEIAVTGTVLRRAGDDLYLDDRKLSISIATVSPANALIHFAVNISNAGTPVKTLSLEDLKIEPKAFALRVMEKFSLEISAIIEATQKVRWVR